MIDEGKPSGEPPRANFLQKSGFSSKHFKSPKRMHIASTRGLGTLRLKSPSRECNSCGTEPYASRKSSISVPVRGSEIYAAPRSATRTDLAETTRR